MHFVVGPEEHCMSVTHQVFAILRSIMLSFSSVGEAASYSWSDCNLYNP